MDSYTLRPMDLRDILDETFDLYKNNILLFVTIAAVVFFPLQILMTFVTGHNPLAQGYTGGSSGPPTLDPIAAMRYGFSILLTVGLASIGRMFAVGALSEAISERYLGRALTAGDAYRVIWSRFGSFLATLTLGGVAVFGSIFLLILAMGTLIAGLVAINNVLGIVIGILLGFVAFPAIIFLAFVFVFIIPVFVVEGRSKVDALKRSYQLYMFSPFKVFFSISLIWFILAIIMGMLIGPISLAFGMMSGGQPNTLMLTIQGAFAGVAQSLIEPIQLIVLVLLYFDVRIRREGFDLEMMANELGKTSAVGSGFEGFNPTDSTTPGGETPF